MTYAKSLTSALALSTLSLALTATSSFAADRVVILSDALPKAEAEITLKQAVKVMASSQPGDSVTFIDGPNGEVIGKVEVPAGKEGAKALKYKKLKAALFGPTMQSLKAHLVDAIKASEKLPSGVLPMQVNIAESLGHLAFYANSQPEVMFLGTPRYTDERAPAYSMEYHFPNEAHWRFEPSATPFGAAGREGTLDGMRVHFCDLDNTYVKAMQKRGLEKAIGLQVQAHGAVLATFSDVIDTCVDRMIAGDAVGSEVYEANPKHVRPIVFDPRNTGEVTPAKVAAQVGMLDTLNISDQDKAELIMQIQRGQTVMTKVKLHDTDSEDGDVVALVSGSVRIRVPLKKKPTEIVVPISNGTLTMEGVHDGGGGITVGVRTEANDKLISPVMKPGQRINLPFVTS